MKQLLLVTVTAFLFISCGNNGNKTADRNNVSSKVEKAITKQLNISILLDLSDRISPTINPNAEQYDLEDIKTVTEYFTANMKKLNAYNAKGKIKVFLMPPPDDSNINSIVSKLNIDCSILDNKGRKNVFDNLTTLYAKSLGKVYNETISANSWIGSDIWRFFKDDVKDYCVDKNPNYRNILIILTDGYLFHPQSIYQKGNRVTSLEKTINKYRVQNFKELINRDDFGILTERDDLQNLEVLVLEVKEKYGIKMDEDILSYVWVKWFKEMNIKHFNIYNSDLPANTKIRIDNFLNQN